MRQLPGFTPAMTVHESKELNMIIRNAYLDRWKTRVTQWLARYSIAMLRISLSLVLLVFGALEFIPGLGPVEDLVADTMGALTLGLIPGRVALLLVATVETVIGLLLVTGRYLRLGLALLGLAMVGILSPLVLFPDRLFMLEGQYVLKDVVPLAAVLVVASGASRRRVITERDEAAPGDHNAKSPKTHGMRQQPSLQRAA
jgi:putative oxidoreductase